MNGSSLVITGNKLRSGYCVFLNGKMKQLTNTSLLALLHFVLAKIEYHDGWLPLSKLCTAWGDPELGRRQIQRLREALDDYDKKLIVNDQRGNYTLNIAFHRITLDSSIWMIRSPEWEPTFLNRLEAIYSTHRPPESRSHDNDLYFQFLVVTSASWQAHELTTTLKCIDQVLLSMLDLSHIVTTTSYRQ